MTKELTASAPFAMEIMVGAPRQEILHCPRQTLPLRGSFSSSSSRTHDRELPNGELITVGVKTLLVSAWEQKFQRVRLWPPSCLVCVGQDRARLTGTCVAHLRPDGAGPS